MLFIVGFGAGGDEWNDVGSQAGAGKKVMSLQDIRCMQNC